MDQKFWQICELEDNVRSFIELSVSAVPEIWIVRLEDGSFICYWPKENPSKKIRSFAIPKNGGNWKTYKCRILMNGAKFSRYEEAREAERIAQNVSCILDCTNDVNSTMDYNVSAVSSDDESLSPQTTGRAQSLISVRDYSSTMNFDVTDYAEGNGNDMTGGELNSTMDFDVSDDTENEKIIGNDSAEYNSAVCRISNFGQTNGTWLKPKANETLVRYDSHSSVESGYSNRFENCTDFLTSTAISEISALGDADVQAILSRITSLESNMLNLCQDLKKDVQQIKQMLSCNSDAKDQSQKSPVIPILNDSQATDEVFLLDDPPGHKSPTHDQSNDKSMPIVVTIAQSDDESGRIVPVIPEHAMESDKILLQMENPVENPNAQLSTHEVGNLVDEAPNTQLSTHDLGEFEETYIVPNQMILPVDNIPEFRANEMVLELNEDMEEATVKRLSPLYNEHEADYMKRTVFSIFTESFFLDKVTWKSEKGRQCIKGSNILKCWKASFETRFSADEENKRFMAHFRRIKNGKRKSVQSSTGLKRGVKGKKN